MPPAQFQGGGRGPTKARAASVPMHNPLNNWATFDVGLLKSTGAVSSAGIPATMLDGDFAASVRGTVCVESVTGAWRGVAGLWMWTSSRGR
jgi:hypothetical protein